jgi:spermidine/putrescine transport system substrate-binding protein
MTPSNNGFPHELTRRSALGAGLVGLAALVAACSSSGNTGSGSSAPVGTGGLTADGVPYPLARKDAPVTWSTSLGIDAVKSGQQVPTGGALEIYTWSSFLASAVVKSFEDKYKCTVSVTTFDSMQEAMTKLSTGKISPDVFTPQINTMGRCVAGKLIAPINHDYLPHFPEVWKYFHNPFYDQQARYTVPFTCTVTGIMYRRDLIPQNVIASLPTGYDLLWQPQYKGKVGLWDDYREALGMAMLRRGVTDLNTGDRAVIDQASKDLVELSRQNNVKIDTLAGTAGIPTGQFVAYQAQSGDPNTALSQMTSNFDEVGFWYPAQRNGTAGNDMLAVGSKSKNPLLAHAFIDHMLTPDNALLNYGFIGYQPPINAANPETLTTMTNPQTGRPYVEPWLADSIVRPVDFERGEPYCELAPDVDVVYLDAWKAVKNS